MGRAYAEADEEATGLAKDRKVFQICLIQPDTRNGNKGLEVEELM
jgi:hypothetical protein